MQKALHIAGLGAAIIRYIPTNDRFQMETDRLAEQLTRDRSEGLLPFLVVGSAGTTDTGAIDPLDRIADIAEAQGLWYHIDAAYGGFFLLVDELCDRFRGIDRSDSLAIDPHKGLFLSSTTIDGVFWIRLAVLSFRSHRREVEICLEVLKEGKKEVGREKWQ